MGDASEHAPRVRVEINNKPLPEYVARQITHISHEDSVDITGKISFSVNNTEELNSAGSFLDEVVLHPGNDVEIWFGYTNELHFIGAGRIVRHIPRFEDNGIRSVEVVAYDRSWMLKHQELELTGSSGRKSRDEKKTKFEGTVGQFLRSLAAKYGMALDISEDLDERPIKFTNRKGVSDYDTLTSLANYLYATNRVEYRDSEDQWYLVFRHLDLPMPQDLRYTLTYATGPYSSLMEITFEYALDNILTEAKAYYYDENAERVNIPIGGGGTTEATTGEWIPLTDDLASEAPSQPSASGPPKKTRWWDIPEVELPAGPTSRKSPTPSALTAAGGNKVGESDYPVLLRLIVGGHSIQIATRPFRDAADAAQAIKSWLKANNDLFIIARGECIGVPIKAGEIHTLESRLFGDTYNGLYYFANVVHTFDGTWKTEFTARKIIEGNVQIMDRQVPESAALRNRMGTERR